MVELSLNKFKFKKLWINKH